MRRFTNTRTREIRQVTQPEPNKVAELSISNEGTNTINTTFDNASEADKFFATYRPTGEGWRETTPKRKTRRRPEFRQVDTERQREHERAAEIATAPCLTDYEMRDDRFDTSPMLVLWFRGSYPPMIHMGMQIRPDLPVFGDTPTDSREGLREIIRTRRPVITEYRETRDVKGVMCAYEIICVLTAATTPADAISGEMANNTIKHKRKRAGKTWDASEFEAPKRHIEFEEDE